MIRSLPGISPADNCILCLHICVCAPLFMHAGIYAYPCRIAYHYKQAFEYKSRRLEPVSCFVFPLRHFPQWRCETGSYSYDQDNDCRAVSEHLALIYTLNTHTIAQQLIYSGNLNVLFCFNVVLLHIVAFTFR